MECKDNVNKYKKDMEKLEDNWNKNMEMMTGGIYLRIRELTTKLKVQCTFADKEHKQLHKEGDNLIQEITELGNNVSHTDRRMYELEGFVGISHDMVSKNNLEEAQLETVQE